MASNIIIDYDLGNLYSIKNASEHVGLNAVISSDPMTIANSHLLILPGVGAFGQAMQNLAQSDLIDPILEHVRAGKPLVGICLGMQLLFGNSEEFGRYSGLNIIPGQVRRLPSDDNGKKRRIPHVGWNRIWTNAAAAREPLLAHLNGNGFAYFVHSYYASPQDSSVISAFTEYEGFEFCAAVRQDNVCGLQFHPEKSGPQGLEMLSKIKKEMAL